MRQMTAAEFKEHYQKQLENHIKGEQKLVENNQQLVMKYADAGKTIKYYAKGKGLPFQHPVHWGAMGCYGLG